MDPVPFSSIYKTAYLICQNMAFFIFLYSGFLLVISLNTRDEVIIITNYQMIDGGTDLNTLHPSRFTRIMIAFVLIIVLLAVLGGSVPSIKASELISNKNEILIAKQSEDAGLYNAQIPDTSSKNFAGNNIPIDTAGTTLIIEQGPLSKNSNQNYQP
jgi:hypothetical protein